MDDRELLRGQYDRMYRAMCEKDMDTLDAVLDENFHLLHMTGMRQDKRGYMKHIQNGTLNYADAHTEDLDISVRGDEAELTGRSRVRAAVFGGGWHSWRLELRMKAIRHGGTWRFCFAAASTY